MQNPTIQTKVADLLLEKSNFSEIANEATSSNAIREVKPANKMHKKNNGPIIDAQGPITL